MSDDQIVFKQQPNTGPGSRVARGNPSNRPSSSFELALGRTNTRQRFLGKTSPSHCQKKSWHAHAGSCPRWSSLSSSNAQFMKMQDAKSSANCVKTFSLSHLGK